MKSAMQFPNSITTEHLLLRPYAISQAVDLLNLANQNRDLLTRNFTPMAQQLVSVETVIEFICNSKAQWKEGSVFQYGVHLGEQLIGQIKIKQINWQEGSMELSYFIYPAWQRKGYASETVRAVLHTALAELNFQTVTLRIIASNQASLRLAESLGFNRIEIRQRDFICGFGEQHDVHYWILKKLNWPSRQ